MNVTECSSVARNECAKTFRIEWVSICVNRSFTFSPCGIPPPSSKSSKVLTLVAELRARRAFVSALSCLCSRRLPDRAVDCEFGLAPYCVEPPKRAVERGRIRKWSLPAHASPLSLPPILFALALHRRRLRVLHLEPVGRAAGAVGRILPLRHYTFEPHLAGMGEDGRAMVSPLGGARLRDGPG